MARTTVVVNDAAIASLFADNSEIGRLTGQVMRNAKAQAKLMAPRRTGRLAASVQGYANRHYTYGRRMALYSDLYYAPFVEKGTTGPIVARHTSRRGGPGWLRVPNRPFGTRYIFKRSVRGQRAQPFMANALERACAGRGLAIYLD